MINIKARPAVAVIEFGKKVEEVVAAGGSVNYGNLQVINHTGFMTIIAEELKTPKQVSEVIVEAPVEAVAEESEETKADVQGKAEITNTGKEKAPRKKRSK